MEDKENRQKNTNVENQGSIDDSVDKCDHPEPTNFDLFVPWACKEYGLDTDVVITRAVQKGYVRVETARQKHHKKLSRIPSILLKEPESEDDFPKGFDMSAEDITREKVQIESVYDNKDNLVQLNFLKNKNILRKIMQVIALTLPYHKYLTSIKINGGLRMDTLYEISKLLPDSQITELCFDGTFLREANYQVLLKQSKVKHLSLARCTINDTVVKTIADQLKDPCPAATILSALNLSTNKITDIGAKYLADMLRRNRQLSYLNLAGNMIKDEGGIMILDTLQKFPLQLKEISECRAKYVAYLKMKNVLVDKFIKELQMELLYKYQSKSKKVVRKAKLESQTAQPNETTSEAQILQERAEYLAESKLGIFNEPYFQDNTETQNGVVYCLGNNTLFYLNLAYNNLTYASLKKLLEVLTVQASLGRTPRGLIKVVIEGNLMPEACEELEEIDHLLAPVITKKRSKWSEISSRKQPSSTRSTAK